MDIPVFNIKKFTYSTMDITQWIGAIFSGGLLVQILRFIKWYKTRKKKTEPAANLAKVLQIYAHMKDVLIHSEMDRFLIFELHNSGGLLMAGVQWKMTATYEDFSKPLKPVKEEYDGFSLDISLANLFKDATDTGKSVAEFDNTDEDTLLRAIMQIRGMKQMQIFFLAQSSNKIFIACISSNLVQYQHLMEEETNRIMIAINNLRPIFKESSKYL